MEEFDGSLVIQIGGDSSEDGDSPQLIEYFFRGENDECFQGVHPQIMKVLKNDLRREKISLPEDMERNMEKQKGTVEKDSDKKKIYEIIRHGRNRIAVLINSPGGYKAAFTFIYEIIDLMKKNNSLVFSFGRKLVSSAAALAFFKGESGRRFIENKTRIILHLSSNVEEYFTQRAIKEDPCELGDLNQCYHEIMEAQREEERQEIVSILQGDAQILHPELAEEIKEAQLRGGDEAIYLWQADIAEFGLAEVKSKYGLRACFEKNMNCGSDAYAKTTIDTFFAKKRKRS